MSSAAQCPDPSIQQDHNAGEVHLPVLHLLPRSCTWLKSPPHSSLFLTCSPRVSPWSSQLCRGWQTVAHELRKVFMLNKYCLIGEKKKERKKETIFTAPLPHQLVGCTRALFCVFATTVRPPAEGALHWALDPVQATLARTHTPHPSHHLPLPSLARFEHRPLVTAQPCSSRPSSALLCPVPQECSPSVPAFSPSSSTPEVLPSAPLSGHRGPYSIKGLVLTIGDIICHR